MEGDVRGIENRVKRYWYSDGIVELVLGGLFFMLGIFLSLMGYLGDDSKAGTAVAVIMVLAMMGGVFSMQRLVDTLKARLTYPRTGYVEYRSGDRAAIRRRHRVMTIAMVSMILLVLILGRLPGLDSTVLGTGLVMGAVFIIVRAKSSGGLRRFYVFGGLSIVLGAGLSLGDLSRSYGLGLFFDVVGITMIITALIVLRTYLGQNPGSANAEQ